MKEKVRHTNLENDAVKQENTKIGSSVVTALVKSNVKPRHLDLLRYSPKSE